MAGIDEFTKLLIQSDTTDGSIVFTDTSPVGRAITRYGDTHHEAAQSAFGATAIEVDGTGDYLTVAAAADLAFGTGGSWCVDFRVMLFSPLPANQYAFDFGANGCVVQFASGKVRFYNPATGISSTLYTAGPTLSAGVEYHIAITHSGGVTRAFVDGVMYASATDSRTYPQANLSIGQYGGTGYNLKGQLREFRVSVGDPRWTSDFTPPSVPYGDIQPAALLVMCEQLYGISGDFVSVSSEQLYSITNSVEASLLQLYSFLLEIWSAQLYGDVPLREKSLVQPYRSASILQKELQQKWGNALAMEVGLFQPWQMPESLEAVSDQRYGIAAAALQATSEQLYHIHANSELFANLVQPYAMAAEAAALYIFDTRIYVDGERIPFITCDWQSTKSEYAWHVDFSVKSLAIATRCAEGAEIVVVSAGDSYRFKCYDGWRLDKRYLETSYRIEAWSPTRDLDLAAPITGDLSGMASVIATDLAAPYGITVDWQMADGHIAAGKLTANNETPLAVIRKLVEDGDRGRMQTAADGVTLLCVCGTETPIPDWPAVTPVQVIDARIERRSTTWQNDIQSGHNSFMVSDQLAAGRTEQLIDNLVDCRTADVRLYVTPLADSPGYVLEHSGGASVSIEPMDIVSEVVLDELVSVEGGIGKTRLPIYGVIARAWREQPLGDIVTSEDGIIQADIAGYSLLRLSYTTRFYQWFARDSKIEEVQFIARRAD